MLTAPSGGRSVISDVIAVLEYRRKRAAPQRGGRSKRTKGKARMVEEDESSEDIHCLVTHLHPSDCANLASAMRAIVTGFVDRQDEGEEDELVLQRKSPSCLIERGFKPV